MIASTCFLVSPWVDQGLFTVFVEGGEWGSVRFASGFVKVPRGPLRFLMSGTQAWRLAAPTISNAALPGSRIITHCSASHVTSMSN